MKVAIKFRPARPKRIYSYLRQSGYLFSIAGIIALIYCGFMLLDAKLDQARQTTRFQRALKVSMPPVAGGKQIQPRPVRPAQPEASRLTPRSLATKGRRGSPLGRIEISAVGIAAMIMEGIDQRTLRRAVGHIPGTPLPGETGNVALAGHRDSFFRGLRNIRKGDDITVTTLEGSYRYRVESTRVVEPDQTEVLDDSGDAILTLVTCYPFAFVGPAPKRFVVRAHWITG
jgi:sortase A